MYNPRPPKPRFIKLTRYDNLTMYVKISSIDAIEEVKFNNSTELLIGGKWINVLESIDDIKNDII